MHKLLARQLLRCIGRSSLDDVSAEWRALVEAVSAAYEQADADRRLLERSVELTSQEFLERYHQLQQEIGQRQVAEERLANEKEGLQRLNTIMMGREERILELKREVNALCDQLGVARRYAI